MKISLARLDLMLQVRYLESRQDMHGSFTVNVDRWKKMVFLGATKVIEESGALANSLHAQNLIKININCQININMKERD